MILVPCFVILKFIVKEFIRISFNEMSTKVAKISNEINSDTKEQIVPTTIQITPKAIAHLEAEANFKEE
jgi:hypothetical protein